MDPELVGDLRAFGVRVQRLRMARNWTQDRLAAEAGFDRTYIAAVEAGRRNVVLVNVFRLARALEVPPDALFRD